MLLVRESHFKYQDFKLYCLSIWVLNHPIFSSFYVGIFHSKAEGILRVSQQEGDKQNEFSRGRAGCLLPTMLGRLKLLGLTGGLAVIYGTGLLTVFAA